MDYLALSVFFTDVLAGVVVVSYSRLILGGMRQLPPALLAGCMSIAALNIYLSPLPLLTLYKWLKVVEFVAIGYLFFKVSLKKEVLATLLLVQVLVQLIVVITQFTRGGTWPNWFYLLGERGFSLSYPGIATVEIAGQEVLRAYGTFSHPNSLGGFYALMGALTLTFLKPLGKRGAWVIAGITLLVFLSFSKVAIIAWLLTLIVYYLGKKPSLPLPFLVTILLAGGVFVLQNVTERSWGERLQQYAHLTQVPVKNWLLGNGLGTGVLQTTIDSVYAPFQAPQPLHNALLLGALEIGILPLLLIVFFIKKMFTWGKPMVFIGITIFITALFDHYLLTLQQNTFLLAVSVGLALQESIKNPTLKK